MKLENLEKVNSIAKEIEQLDEELVEIGKWERDSEENTEVTIEFKAFGQYYTNSFRFSKKQLNGIMYDGKSNLNDIRKSLIKELSTL